MLQFYLQLRTLSSRFMGASASCERQCTYEQEPKPRKLTLALYKLLAPVAWHWGLMVDEDLYEVQGFGLGWDQMKVFCSRGLVAPASLQQQMPERKSKKLEEFNGYVELRYTTLKSDVEIETFIREWVAAHPTYNLLRHNCQLFVYEFYGFLTGQAFPFRMDNRIMSCSPAPNRSGQVSWQDRDKDCVQVGAASREVVLQTQDDLYLHVSLGNWFCPAKVTVASEDSSCTRLTLVERAGGVIHMKTAHGRWLSAPATMGSALTIVEKVRPQQWTFGAQRAGSSVFFLERVDRDSFRLKADHGGYVVAPRDAGATVTVTASVDDAGLFFFR